MAEQELHPALIRIRDKYPASKCLVDEWDKIKKLIQQGKEDEAEAIAKQCLDENPKLKIRNKIAVKHRILRREYLKFQRDLELKIKEVFEKLTAKIGDMLLSTSDYDGKIPLYKMNPILKRLKIYNREAFMEIKNLITEGMRESIWYGIVVSMDSAEAGLELSRQMNKEMFYSMTAPEELAIREGLQSATIARTGGVFQTIFDRVKQRQIKRGLFGGKKGIYTRGVKLSQTVWDLRDDNLRRMRNLISSGIAQGRSATSMASNVKGYTSVGKLTIDMPLPRGVYKSAYKNALRMTRTETNRAYVDAELEYAKYKGYKKMWNVNVGHRTEDECFKAGTLIVTDKGLKKIESISNEDWVLTHKNRFKRVTKTFKNVIQNGTLIKLNFQVGKNHIREIFCTPNHPFLIDGQWIKANDLEIKCYGTSPFLLLERLINKTVVQIKNEYVYNLAVDEDNSYFANGIAVHNCDALHGKVFEPDEVPYPQHVSDACMPGNTKIEIENNKQIRIDKLKVGDKVMTYSGVVNRISCIWTRFVKESIIRIRVGPASLWLTNNHPILTERGFVNAEDIHKGDKVYISKRIMTESNIENMPSFVFKFNPLFFIFQYFFRRAMPFPTVNFNSNMQIGDCNINIPFSYSQERDTIKTNNTNEISHNCFTRSKSTNSLNSFRFIRKSFKRHFFTSKLFSTLFSSLLSKSFTFFRPYELPRLRQSTPRKIMFFKSICNTFARYIHFIGELFNRHISRKMSMVDCKDIKIANDTHDNQLYQTIPVISTKKVYYKGFVYNLTVEKDETYIANGIVVHNCYLTTVIPGIS